ncbi:hypothetical protein HYW39_00365 [Candidatus Curtissbacteria bacterium]|nr:hypothetical protein [Candidatus Curtissbacteria bacterium]MBI2594133.1 hypothetical protein [Candidatus Curtissbacteria bacterium]
METTKKISWRVIWYSVLIYLLAFIASGLVVLPWFYLVLPMIVFWTTVYYFRSAERTFAAGLRVSLFWFFLISILSAIEIIGPYYANALFYFSDGRNWLLYPLILLIPVIYSLILENNSKKKGRKRKFRNFREIVPLGPNQASV